MQKLKKDTFVYCVSYDEKRDFFEVHFNRVEKIDSDRIWFSDGSFLESSEYNVCMKTDYGFYNCEATDRITAVNNLLDYMWEYYEQKEPKYAAKYHQEKIFYLRNQYGLA